MNKYSIRATSFFLSLIIVGNFLNPNIANRDTSANAAGREAVMMDNKYYLPMVMKPMPDPITAADLVPIDFRIQALDLDGVPLSGVKVYAIHQDLLFRQSGFTDGNGYFSIKGIPGKWAIYGSLNGEYAYNHAGWGYAPILHDISITENEQVVELRPDITITLSYQNDLPIGGYCSNTYIHVIEQSYGQMVGMDVAGMFSWCNLSVQIQTNQNFTARVGMTTWPYSTSPGFFYLGDAKPLNQDLVETLNSEKMGSIEVGAFDSPGGTAIPYHFQVQNFERSWSWNPFITDMQSGPHMYYFSPGHYTFLRGVNLEGWQMRLHTIALEIQAGDYETIYMSKPSSSRVLVSPQPAPGFGDYTQVLLDLRDGFNNQVIEMWQTGTATTPHVRITTPGGRVAEVNMSFGFAGKISATFTQTENPSYQVTWDYGPFGNGSLSGIVYDPPVLAEYSYTTEHLIPQSPAVQWDIHSAWVEYYEQLYNSMETLLGVPIDYPIGIIQNSMHAGYAYEILHGFKTEIPIEFNQAPSVYTTNFFNAHEEGHGRIHKGPANFYAFQYYAESYATLMGYESVALTVNAPRYIDWLYAYHNLIINHLHGEAVDTDSERIEAMQFVLYFIRHYYGIEPHRRFIIEWANAFSSVKSSLSSYSDLEKFAAIYSYLVGGDNLAWVFDLAGIPLSTSRVAAALGIVNSTAVSPTNKIELGLGNVTAVHSLVSIPVMVKRSPVEGFDDLHLVLTYDPSKLSCLGVIPRDLTISPYWQITFDISTPGSIIIDLNGLNPVEGIGTIAQVNFQLMPSKNGSTSVNFSQTASMDFSVTTTSGSITFPSSPTQIILPPLPIGQVGVSYSTLLKGIGGAIPYTWSYAQFNLPNGLTLNSTTGLISGTPTTPGVFTFIVKMRDNNAVIHQRKFTIEIMP